MMPAGQVCLLKTREAIAEGQVNEPPGAATSKDRSMFSKDIDRCLGYNYY